MRNSQTTTLGEIDLDEALDAFESWIYQDPYSWVSAPTVAPVPLTTTGKGIQ